MQANKDRRPQAVMISKRANVFYLEHVRVMQKDDRVVYLTESDDGVDKFVSIPDKNTAFLLLGKGTSITDDRNEEAGRIECCRWNVWIRRDSIVRPL